MKQFFKMVFASMLGFILANVLIILLFLGIVFAFVSSVSTEKKVIVSTNSILQIQFDYPIPERTSSNPFQDFDWQSMKASKKLGLNDILSSLKKAETEENIKGIFMNLSTLQAGMATIEEIRNALLDFKKSGKFIYAYGENFTQGAYYLATAADKIYLNPQGMIDFRGLRSEIMFFKNTFEKLEVEPQVIRHGKYKSFAEPFIQDKMSPENREQMNVLLQSVWTHIKEETGKTRKISPSELQDIADKFSARTPEDALRLHMIDSIVYMDEMLEVIKKNVGLAENEKINFVKLSKVNSSTEQAGKKPRTKEKIAIIYATGGISGGNGDDESIGSDAMSETIRKARKDSSIKAIVLRINSPGGSALASEVIWREIILAKKSKPVVVSMGDVAASGGYYIACGADKIVAEPNTITGSIGVFGIFFNGKKLLNNKLGITVDTVKTGRFADLGSPTRPLTEAEKSIIQQWIENVYDVFTTRVADGRKMSKEAVDNIGQGRVWSGTDALRLGLVDEIGGTQKAIDIASKLAKVENYKLVELPEKKEPFEEIIKEFSEDVEMFFVKNKMGEEQFRYYRQLQSMIKYNGLQARMPFGIEFY